MAAEGSEEKKEIIMRKKNSMITFSALSNLIATICEVIIEGKIV